MEELNIEAHKFEESKNQLKKFSEDTETEFEIKRVESKKDVGEFWLDILLLRGIEDDHMVKGSELNEFAADVQKYFMDINNLQRQFIEQFGNVYNALESLDKDYIQAILVSIKSAQKAYEKANGARKDIEKTVEEQQKIIKVLQKFKEKLDKNEHLDDVDNLWQDNQNMKKSIEELENNVKKCISKYDELLRLIKHKENSVNINEVLSSENKNIKKKITEIDNKYSKKIKIAYTIAGSSVVLVIVNLILSMTGVL